MRSRAWALFPYLLGLMFTWSAAMYGVFAIPEYLLVFQVIAAVSFCCYFPVIVRFRPQLPPPLPTGD
jgi:hypothetical protein